jgi:polysaccharide biosynthesis transport protein
MSELSPYLIHRNRVPGGLLMHPSRTGPSMSEGIGLDEIWRVIRRRARLTVPLGIALLTITAIVLFLITPNYTAQTTLLIEPEAPQVLNMTQLLADTAGNEDYDYYKTQFELLKSRALAARVIRELNLSQNPLFNPQPPEEGTLAYRWNRAREWFVGLFQSDVPDSAPDSRENWVDPVLIDEYVSRVKVEPVLATRLVTVSFTLEDPVLATEIVNLHVKDFVKRELEIRSSAQRTAEEFLKSQLASIGQRTEQAEAALNAYRQQQGVLSFDVNDNNKVAAQRMSDLTKALTDAETRRITAQSQVELVSHGDYDSLPQVVSNPTISALKPQLVTLQTEYARLSAAFNPSYPKLVELKAQLNQDQSAMAAQIKNIAGAIQRDYNAAFAQETRLRNEIQTEKQKDMTLNDALLRDAVLSREVQANRDLYKNVLQRMEEMSVAAETPLSNISIVERAMSPRSPSSPKKKIDLAIAAVVVILLGVALSFILEQLDKRLRTPEEIDAYLELPSLAVVPDFKKLGGIAWTPRKLLPGRRSGRLEVASKTGPLVVLSPLDEYKRGAKEVYRVIRTNIMFSRGSAPPKTVLFTSSVENEGKTWTAVHTAASFAHTGAATVLVSADLRRPRCDRLLNCEGTVGLSDALLGRRDPLEVIRRINRQPFFFLSAGSRVSNPAELLTSARMREVVESLAHHYQFVLFDSAPLMHASETLAIATMVDGVVMVVGAATPKQNVRSACDRLTRVEAKILGVVLNRVNIKQPDYRDYTRNYDRYDFDDQSEAEIVGTPQA